ncbi:hypothetical protein [Microbacterium enclense]|uniref:D-alanyl-D-alanine carboxypeptidase n=1 Tax=Microbacterium enclense TaxID=993073 RepID=A0A1G6NX18_9MICO|nr:hypothetical protein [Microbacterium enclense]KSU52903.1 hypothetical protein AS029_12915 [Microbacterium enclense]SDC71715.1 hypothetical protein SAMN05216418_2863 [Microbacterium enclense]
MPRYANGQAPLSALVKLSDQHYLPEGTAARWRELQRLAWEKYGVWLIISPGWNAYRPLSIQYEYRAELGIWAAVPGYSSHGLNFNGRDCAAIDVYNWASLGWGRFVALCRLVGFTVDFVSPQELWHIGDFDPWSVPTFAAITINPETTKLPEPEEADDMPINFRSTTGGVSFTMVPGICITRHYNETAAANTNYFNTGKQWPGENARQEDREKAGERQLTDAGILMLLKQYGFAWASRDIARLPMDGETLYADHILQQRGVEIAS